MKKIFLLALICFSKIIFAGNALEVSTKEKQKESVYESSLYEYELKTKAELSESEIDEVNLALCSAISAAQLNGETFPKFYEALKELKIYNGTREDFAPFFNNFLNQYGEKLKCRAYPNFDFKEEHIFKRMLNFQLTDYYYDYLLMQKKGAINFNIYEIVDGKKETLIDFIDKMIKRKLGNEDTLDDIKDELLNLGALSGEDYEKLLSQQEE